MLIKVYEGIFLNQIFLPDSPLKYLNSYIITDEERPLIIDTGFNRRECRESFFAGVRELKLDPAKCSVLATHMHSDHSGLLGELQSLGAGIMLGRHDISGIEELNAPSHEERISKWEQMFDLKKYAITTADHPGYHYRSQPFTQCRPLDEGEVLKAGGYSLRVINVPGHTRGHIALYEEKHKLFFGGDLILEKITPTVVFKGFTQDILAVYLDTLRKTRRFAINTLFTGHRAIINDPRRRIDQLISHHVRRLDEIKAILAAGEHSVSAAASKMTWAIRADNWEVFPKSQKWFACGEAMSHLEHLRFTGAVKRREEDGVCFYSLL